MSSSLLSVFVVALKAVLVIQGDRGSDEETPPRLVVVEGTIQDPSHVDVLVVVVRHDGTWNETNAKA